MIRLVNILIIFLTFVVPISYGEEYKFAGLKNIEIDKNEDIYVFGGVKGKTGVLKISKNGLLIKMLGDKYSEISFRRDELRAGYMRFVEGGQLYGPGKYQYFSLGRGVRKYMWGLTSEVFILAENEKIFNEIFNFLGENPSTDNLLNKTIRFIGPIAVNSKTQLCVLGWGLEKANLPVLEKGKIQKRENGEIIYTDEFYEQKVAILDPGDGHPILVFGKSGINTGELYLPTDIAVDDLGNIYVVDSWRQKVIKFDSSGSFIKEWGKWGSGDGEFKAPRNIAIDKNKKVIYVVDSAGPPGSDPYAVGQYRVNKFDLEGKFIGKWGDSHITRFGWFWLAPAPIRKYDLDDPRSIAVGPDGSVWLIEVHKPCISKFTPDGKLLLRFGKKGDVNGDPRGEIGWYSEGIAVGPDGMVYVCDNGRTSKHVKKIDEHTKKFREYLTKTGKQDFKEKSPEPETRIVKYDSEGGYLGEMKGD